MSSPAQPSSLADREALWTQFLQRWPLDQLARMTLRDYNQAGEDDHFCRWLEKRTEALGSIWGGSSLKFGIYSRSSSATKEPSAQKGVMQDEHYGWYAKYGRTAEEAFAAIRALIVQTAQAARAGRLDEVEGIDLWPIVRRKIAFLYQDREQPCILPVYMAPLLRQVWPGPGEAPEDGVALYQAFMARRGSQPVLAYADGIWAQIEAAQAREAAAAGEAPPASSHATLQAQPMPALNQILYGPPGTGKTFATIEEALAILDPDHLAANRSGRAALKDRFDALVQEQRIRFVTFHQSFSYEDFVEGLRATTHEDSGQIAYEVVDGVFKSLCEAAAAKVMRPQEAAAEEAPIELGGRRIWKMSLGNTLGSDAAIYEECIERGYALLGYGGSVDFTGCTSRAEVQERFTTGGLKVENPQTDYGITSVTNFVSRMKPGDLLVISDGNFKFRAIGEVSGAYSFQPHGEYPDGYAQMRPVRWLRVYEPSLPHGELMSKQFSQMTLYELRTPSIDLAKLQRLLNPQTRAGAEADALAPGAAGNDARVLVIDEINRGNISRIFGELITLIEPSKRAGADEALEVVLPYSKTPFSVPSNVYLIGTMNTADRSLTAMDVALRRRFVFKAMPPRPALLEGVVVEGVPVDRLLAVMNQRIEALLDRDHCLGHAYFMPLQQEPALARLAEVFRNQVLPLLQEYFFDDWQRIQWVLNDHRKPAAFRFVSGQAVDVEALFGNDVNVARSPTAWSVNAAAFGYAESYLGVIDPTEVLDTE